ncbi:hypothetical protein AAFN87_03585 [Solibacillus sp. CAU 1738]
MNWQQLQQQHETLQLQLLSAEKLKKQQQALERQILHTESEIEKLTQQLNKTRQQLNKMEKFSFVNLFRNWTGKQSELLEEKLDVVATKELKLIETQLIREDLQDDLVDTMFKINAINEQYIQQELEKLTRQKEYWLMQHAPQVAKQLNALIEQELLVKQLKTEIHEAIDAGKQASITLTDAAKSLSDAKSFSTWDTFFGGGFIVTAMKHDKLDKSNAYIHQAQIALQRFQNELLDIQNMSQKSTTIEVDGFVKFADYFFDDIFSAWSVHSKIATATDQIRRVLDDISNTIFELKTKLALAVEKEQEIDDQKRAILKTEDPSLFF